MIAAEGRKRSTTARIRRFTAIGTVLCAMLAATGTLEQQPKMQDAALHIVVIEGEDSVNIIGQGTAIPTLVEVRDRNDLPVSGAAVVFLLGDGGTAALNGGLQQVVSTTNALGQATVTVNPVASGAVQLTVNATFEGQTAAASIVQTNFATVAEAAAATGTTGSASGSAASGAGAATGGGGLGAGALAGIVGAAAGAAVGVGAAVSGDKAAANDKDDRTADDDDVTPDDEGNDDPTPSASVPSAPAAPRLTPANSELGVNWQAPADNGSTIDDYDVRYRTGGEAWTELPDRIRSTSRSATIRGLRNGTAHGVQVRAGNAVGDGPWSATATGTPGATETAGARATGPCSSTSTTPQMARTGGITITGTATNHSRTGTEWRQTQADA